MHRSLLLFSSLIFLSAMAHADLDLYRAETIVTGTVEPERARGFRVGLTDVVVKLTGDVRLAETDRLAPLLEQPHQLVEAFEYEDRMKNLPVRDEQGTRERPHFLRIRFKPAELDAALARIGLAKWTQERPRLAVWLGVKTAVGSFIVTTTGNDYGQRVVILETAQRRGIPIWLPEEGRSSGVTYDDLAADKIDKIADIAKGTDAALSGVLSLNESGYWDIVWRLRWQGRMRVWTRPGVSFDLAIKDGLQTAALIFSGNMPM